MGRVSNILAYKGTEVFTTLPDTTVYDAIAVMESRNVGALVVVEGKDVCGMITERDYLRKVVLKGRLSRDTTVRQIMTGTLAFVHTDDTIDYCMSVMTKQRCRHLPVIDDGKLSGILSIGDVVKQVVREQEQEIKYLHEYMEGPSFSQESSV